MRSTTPIEHPPQGAKLYDDPSKVKVLHIPRTGGHARGASLRGAAMHGLVGLAPHNTRASMVKGPVICFVRNPVTRFLSAARRLNVDPEELLDRHDKLRSLRGAPELLLRHQTWWIDRPGVDVFQTEQMDVVWPKLVTKWGWPVNPLPSKGAADRNESPGGLPEISSDMYANILLSYSDDWDLWVEAYVDQT